MIFPGCGPLSGPEPRLAFQSAAATATEESLFDDNGNETGDEQAQQSAEYDISHRGSSFLPVRTRRWPTLVL